MRNILVTFLFISIPLFVSANGLTQNAGRLLREHQQKRLGLSAEEKRDMQETKESTFAQLINPQDISDMRTFPQRYFYNGGFARDDHSPVIFYICGEATCSAGGLSGAVGKYAQSLQAHRITLEHRYYGYSQPFANLSVDNMKYLTVENALSDLQRFQQWVQNTMGLKGPWIVVGGSYPGSLSAYYRFKYPQLAVGSLASSAPVEARENFEEYDAAVTRAAGPQCTAKMLEVVQRIESNLNNPTELAKYKAMFGAERVSDGVDFLWVIADMGAVAIQYGYRDEFCNKLLTSIDPVKAYADEGRWLFSMMGITALMDSPEGAMSENPNDYISGWGMRQWMYQSCTQYGYWQGAHSDSTLRSRSTLLNLEYFRNTCRRMFGPNVPAAAAVNEMNQNYYEPMRIMGTASRIYFVNGSVDPWSQLSITKERENSHNTGLDLMTVQGAAHCDDLGYDSTTDSSQLKEARAKALRNFNVWLKGR